MKRIAPRGDGLRQVLIADRQAGVDRWNGRLAAGEAPGWSADTRPMRDELLEELKSGGPVEVDSATLMVALMHAKLDYRAYAFGGVHEGKRFELDEQDRLTELAD